MESLLGEEEVSSGQTSITAKKRVNIWSHRWMTLKFLQEFLEDVFLVLAMEYLLCEPEIRSRRTRVTT
jgi:hypothetical protein